jgi:hypothetical protein
VEGVEIGERAQVGVLHGILGILGTAEQPASQVVRGIQVRQQSRFKPLAPRSLRQTQFPPNSIFDMRRFIPTPENLDRCQ